MATVPLGAHSAEPKRLAPSLPLRQSFVRLVGGWRRLQTGIILVVTVVAVIAIKGRAGVLGVVRAVGRWCCIPGSVLVRAAVIIVLASSAIVVVGLVGVVDARLAVRSHPAGSVVGPGATLTTTTGDCA